MDQLVTDPDPRVVRLLAERRGISSTLAKINGRNAHREVGVGDIADHADSEVQIKEDFSLQRVHASLLEQIDEALRRFTPKTYGICQTCGNPIPPIRLEAAPWARDCRPCREKIPS